MVNDKKIKEIYNCKYIISVDELFPLQEWYNRLLDKHLSEISVSDTLKMMRQNKFLDIALSKAIEYLTVNVFEGDMYEGELLEKLSQAKNIYWKVYSDEIENILARAQYENEKHDWMCDEEKDEFLLLVESFKSKFDEIKFIDGV